MTDKPSKRPHQSQDCHCPPCEKFDGPSISGPPIVVMPAPSPSDAELPPKPVEGAPQIEVSPFRQLCGYWIRIDASTYETWKEVADNPYNSPEFRDKLREILSTFPR